MKTYKKRSTIQKDLLPYLDIASGTLRLRRGGSTLSTQILEIHGLNFYLLSEDEQMQVFQAYQQMLNAITYPLQMIVRVQHLAVEAYQKSLLEEHGAPETPLHLFREDHLSFLRDQTNQERLLERRFYLVVPADVPRTEHVFSKKARTEQAELTRTQIDQQLSLRVQQLRKHCSAIGLPVRLLERAEIVRLLDSMVSGHDPIWTDEELHLTEGELLIDQIAPASVLFQPESILVNQSEYLSTLVIRRFPRHVSPGWLQPLVLSKETFDLILTQHPYPQREARDMLRKKQTQYQSHMVHAMKKGNLVSPDMAMAGDDIAPLISQIEARTNQLHGLSMHVLVRASSEQELRERVQRIQETIHTIGSYRPHVLQYEQETGYRVAMPGSFHYRDMLPLDSTSLATMYPFFSSILYEPTEGAILEGITPQREPIVYDRWRLFNANRLIVAPSGSGKSFKIKIDILRSFVMRRKIDHQIIVIDPEAEYLELAKAMDGQVIRMAPGSPHTINPFDLPKRTSEGEGDILATQVQFLLMFLDVLLAPRSEAHPHATLTVEEQAELELAVYEAYRRVGITRDPETHQRQPPLLRDLYHILADSDPGTDASKLAKRLRRYTHGSLSGMFSGQTNVDLSNRLVVFDVRKLEGELRAVGLMLITQLVWLSAINDPKQRELIIDELLTLYAYDSGAQFARRMFERSRKYWIATTAATQHIHLLENDPSILTNCSTHILLRQHPSHIETIAETFHLSEEEERLIQGFGQGEALLLVERNHIHVQFLASDLEYRYAHTDPEQRRGVRTHGS